MKIRFALGVAAVAFAMGTAQAHDDSKRVYTIPSAPVTSDSAIHSGARNVDDAALADSIAAAFAADRTLSKTAGFVATVSAKNGRVSLSGSAKTAEQAAKAEKIASDIAGRANVSGTLDISGS
jgi:osmotically-inducible protein OsmY